MIRLRCSLSSHYASSRQQQFARVEKRWLPTLQYADLVVIDNSDSIAAASIANGNSNHNQDTNPKRGRKSAAHSCCWTPCTKIHMQFITTANKGDYELNRCDSNCNYNYSNCDDSHDEPGFCYQFGKSLKSFLTTCCLYPCIWCLAP